MSGFLISISNKITSSNLTTIYDDEEEESEADYLPRETTFTTIFTGSILQISRNKPIKTQLAICEVTVFAGAYMILCQTSKQPLKM